MTEVQRDEMLANATLPVFEFWVEGISSLLLNNPAGMAQPTTSLGRAKKIPLPHEEAEQKVYRDKDGWLYLPSRCFRSAIKEAAKGRKLGSKFATTLVKGTIFNCDATTNLIDPVTGELVKDYQIHTVRAVVQNSGVLRSRPEVERWGCRVFLEVDTEAIQIEHVLELLQIAGKVAGVGDWRPQKDGPHGRFKADLVGQVG